MVGGAIRCFMASAVMPASRPPAAPSRWPVIDLVEDIAICTRVLAEQRLDRQRFQLGR